MGREAASFRRSAPTARVLLFLFVGLFAAIALGCRPAAPTAAGPSQSRDVQLVKEKVRIGVLPIASASGNWVAIAKGSFEQEGIEPDVTIFQTAADMVAPLGTGQLDVGAGATGVGLAAAVLRGIDIKIVADQATLIPGHKYQAIAVRRDLYESGQVTGPADLKGRRFAIPGTTGISPEAMLNRYMQRAGLTARDVELVAMPFPDMAVAFANGAIDVGLSIEPFLSQILENGDAVALEYADTIYPYQQVAVVLYSGDFAKKTDLAVRYMLAYLRAVRDYNDAFFKDDATERARVSDILVEYTPMKNRALYDKMAFAGLNPNGVVNVDGLKADQDYYIGAKLQERPADLDRVVDPSFAEAAVRRLGPY